MGGVRLDGARHGFPAFREKATSSALVLNEFSQMSRGHLVLILSTGDYTYLYGGLLHLCVKLELALVTRRSSHQHISSNHRDDVLRSNRGKDHFLWRKAVWRVPQGGT